MLKQRESESSNLHIIFVDCRPTEERSVATIPGSVPHERFDAGNTPVGVEVIAFCTVGYRSGVFAKKIQSERAGLNPRNLEGGILAWVHAGGDVVDEHGKSTKRVHVYGSAWNLLPASHRGVIGPPDAQVEL